MRLELLILTCLAASLPTNAYAQTNGGAEASSEGIATPRASRVGNPDSPRNVLRRVLIQAAKSRAAPTGAALPKNDQLAIATSGFR